MHAGKIAHLEAERPVDQTTQLRRLESDNADLASRLAAAERGASQSAASQAEAAERDTEHLQVRLR